MFKKIVVVIAWMVFLALSGVVLNDRWEQGRAVGITGPY